MSPQAFAAPTYGSLSLLELRSPEFIVTSFVRSSLPWLFGHSRCRRFIEDAYPSSVHAVDERSLVYRVGQKHSSHYVVGSKDLGREENLELQRAKFHFCVFHFFKFLIQHFSSGRPTRPPAGNTGKQLSIFDEKNDMIVAAHAVHCWP